MEYEILELKNGLRIIHSHKKDAEISHCGLLINAGTRDETPEDAGIAHFIEHVLFKGTKKRKAFHILNRLESVGGELNAYTSKEETCVYASFLNIRTIPLSRYTMSLRRLFFLVIPFQFPFWERLNR